MKQLLNQKNKFIFKRLYSSQNTNITSKTKIVCTIGPASDSVEVLEKMSVSGMDVVRFNFSHDTHESHTKRFNVVKQVAKSTKRHISILCDIQGPKIRVGQMEKPIQVVKDQIINVTSEQIIGNEKRIQISYPNIHQDLNIGDKIYVNDGIIDMDIVEKNGTDLVCKIISGGTISSKKGCNLPSGNLSIEVLSEKDKKDLVLISKLNPEFIAVSFVGNGEDVIKVRNFLKETGNSSIKIISKIERPVAVKNIDSIIKESDGIMVARGDLGVEIPLCEVPTAQKMMIKKANIEGKFSIVATQMLESMIQNSRPTRAETNDVYNAVLDGTDAVMLSGETSVGADPLQVVKTMDLIVNEAEKHIASRNPSDFASGRSEIVEAIGLSLYSLSDQFEKFNWKGKFIIMTSSGYLARMVSKYRPKMPIIVLSDNERTVREMTLLWGVRALLVDPQMINEQKTLECINFIEREGLIDSSDTHAVFMGSMKSTYGQNLAILDLKKIRELKK